MDRVESRLLHMMSTRIPIHLPIDLVLLTFQCLRFVQTITTFIRYTPNPDPSLSPPRLLPPLLRRPPCPTRGRLPLLAAVRGDTGHCLPLSTPPPVHDHGSQPLFAPTRAAARHRLPPSIAASRARPPAMVRCLPCAAMVTSHPAAACLRAPPPSCFTEKTTSSSLFNIPKSIFQHFVLSISSFRISNFNIFSINC